jgi:uncharacterized membrane protein
MTSLPLFSLLAFILMLVLLPVLFGELMAARLAKLHLSPEAALLLMMAIIIGGFVNIHGPRAPRDDHRCQLRRLCRPNWACSL